MANIFTPGATSVDEVKTRFGAADQAAVDFVPATAANAEAKVNLFQTAAAKAQERLRSVTDLTRAYQADLASVTEREKPLLAAESDVAARAAKRASMNPFVRPILELIHPSLSAEEIDTDQTAIHLQRQALSDEFMNVNRQYSQSLASNKEIWGAEDGAIQAEGQLNDAKFAGQFATVQATMQAFESSVKGLSAVAQGRSNETQLAAFALNDMDDSQVSAALAEAQHSGKNFIERNGVKIPIGMIEETRQKDTASQVQAEAAQMALVGGRLDLHQKLQGNAIAQMSDQKLSQLVNSADGGGFPIGDLKAEFVRRNNLSATANTITDTQTAGSARGAQLISNSFGLAGTLTRRYGFANGTGNIEDVNVSRASQQYNTIGMKWVERLKSGKPLTPQEESQMNTEIDGGLQTLHRTMTDSLDKSSGSKEESAARAAFMTGGRISADAASSLVTSGIIGGLSADQMGLKGPSKVSYTAGQAKLASLVAKASGKTPEQVAAMSPREQAAMLQDSMGGREPKLTKAELQREVGIAVSGVQAQQIAETMQHNLPDLARRVGAPFGQLDGAAWQASMAAGQRYADTVVAQKFGITEGEAADIRTKGSKSPLYQKLFNDGKIKVGADVIQNAAGYAEGAGTWQFADKHFTTPDFIPSREASKFLNSPEYKGMAGVVQPVMANQNFGNYVMDSLLGSAVSDNADKIRRVYGSAAAQRQIEIADFQKNGVKLYNNDAKLRFSTTLHLVNGLTDQDVGTLLKAVEGHLPRGPDSDKVAQAVVRGGAHPPSGPRYDDAFTVMGSLKFNDPHLESLRKKAMSDLSNAQSRADRFMGVFGSVDQRIN